MNFNLLSYYLNEAGISHSQIEYITMYFNDLLFDYDNKFLSVIEGEFDTDKITSNIIKLSEEKFTEIEYEKNKQNKIKFSIPKLNIKFYFTSDSKIIIANSEIFEDIEKQKYQKKENIKYIKNLNKVYNESGLWIVYETTPNFPSLAKINLRKIFEGIDYILIKSEYSNKQPDNNPTMEKKSNSNSTAFFELIIVCDDYQTTKDIIDIINNIFYELDKIYHNDPQMMDFLSNISLKTKNNNELIISMDYALENLLYIYDSLSQF